MTPIKIVSLCQRAVIRQRRGVTANYLWGAWILGHVLQYLEGRPQRLSRVASWWKLQP